MRVMRIAKAVLSAAVLALASFAVAQDDDSHFDVGLSYSGIFSRNSASSVNSTTLNPTTSGGVLGTVRYRLNHTHGIAVNIGHTNNSQVFTIPPDTFRVIAGITEFSAAYMFKPVPCQMARSLRSSRRRLLRFGAGGQYIDGFLSPFGAKNQTSLAVLYGGGTDYRLWRSVALRVQYRGLFYKAPDFTQYTVVLAARTGTWRNPRRAWL